MTPLCLHREEWVCERCLKCGKCCECKPAGALVHRNSKTASEQYRGMLRGQTTPLGQPVGGKDA